MELNSKRLYQSSGKEKESCCLLFPSSTKREIRHCYVVVVQGRQRNVRKSVMHVQSCCFVNLIHTFCFLPFSLPSPLSDLTLPDYYHYQYDYHNHHHHHHHHRYLHLHLHLHLHHHHHHHHYYCY